MAAPDQPRIEPPVAPSEFRAAVAQVHRARFRSELFVEDMPAPQRIAPFATALTADVTVDGEDTGSGRLVVLHDPAGNDAWGGTFRCVAYVRAEIDPELVTDPMLAGVGWSWLVEALDAHEAAYSAPSGSVTCVSSESFGGMLEEPATAQLEIRASWSPEGDMTPHVEAWGELLCTAVGLPPVPEGVVHLGSGPSRRGQRGPAR